MQPQIDWTQAPKGARWWAMDANGHAHWFVVPEAVVVTNLWNSEPVPAPTFGFAGDWRDSLVERPAGA